MPDILQLGDATADEQLRAYYAEIERLAELARAREIQQAEFERRMNEAVLAALLLAFLLGGGNPQSGDGNEYIQRQRAIHEASVRGMSDDIYGGRYDARGGEAGDVSRGREGEAGDVSRTRLLQRLALWTFAWGRVWNNAKRFPPPEPPRVGQPPPAEPRLRWVFDPAKEHCDDCARLHNTVLTVSEWGSLGIEPQSPQLQCGGWRCGCVWQPTGAPSDWATIANTSLGAEIRDAIAVHSHL